MENTGKILFDDPSPQWFIALGKQWVGPLSAADVYQKVMSREITWAHYIWRKGQRDWQRICDVPTFQAVSPNAPSKAVQQEVNEKSREIAKAQKTAKAPPPAPKDEEEEAEPSDKIWFLHFNDTQYGPVSVAEIGQFLKSGKIHPRVYVWRDGMAGWERLEKIAELQKLTKGTPAEMIEKAETPAKAAKSGKTGKTGKIEKTEKADKRQAPRKPLVAKILMSDDESLIVAVCRDISIGGMQVLTDQIPGPVGARIKLNVSPPDAGKSSKDAAFLAEKGKFKPFVAEGSIVRILEDGRGFSFRFEKLSESAKRSIESYIAAHG